MKKVININFQGRVIPIEETAYDMLTRYVESLRLFFANEEGKDEIINDIEGRIAELFSETLKKGGTCITDEDVNKIIDSMGRPEDFDDDEAKVHTKLGQESTGQQSYTYEQPKNEHKRLYRDENHRVLGGVCSGIANYFSVDSIIVRVLFIVFFGIAFIPYLILWVAVPGSSSIAIGSQRKRLFRDPDTKMIGGVCSGLAQYFAVQVWIPRLLFLIPFFSFVFHWNHWGWYNFPSFLGVSFSPGAAFIYIIFWLVLPEAKTTADKLEMKGEKVDLNNIKSTIQGDMEGFKERAETFGAELKERAQTFSNNFSTKGQGFQNNPNYAAASANAAKATAAARKSANGLAGFLVTVIKVFAYFILGCVLFSIVVSLFSIGVAVTSLIPAKDYVLRSGWQNLLAWGTLILFIWVPVVGIITFIIRRLAKKRGNSGLIRYTLLCLWLLGVFCFAGLIVSLVKDFRYRNIPVEQQLSLSDPGVNKLSIKISPFDKYYTQNWFKLTPFAAVEGDTVFARNIRLRIVKSSKDSFEVTMVKLTNGRTRQEADMLASRINFNVRQIDSTLLLDKGIAFTDREKFRNQQVVITVAVPVGKRIYVNENVGWDNVHLGDDDFWDWENDMEKESASLKWRHNVEYIMTADGLERVDLKKDDDDSRDEDQNDAIEQYRKSKEQMEREKEQKLRELEEIDKELQKTTDSTRYRYQPPQSAPGRKRVETPKSTAKVDLPFGASDLLMIKFPI